MERGTYTAASGGVAALRKIDVVNNNLANANTAGFKKELLVGTTQSFDETLAKLVAKGDPYARGDHERTPGIVHVSSVTDFSPGPISQTGNNFDVALRNPNDFLVVNTPQGTRYTRAGNLTLNGAGELSTIDGMQVQGEGGAITIVGGSPVISPNGAVLVNGLQIGKLQVARFENPEVLERDGGTRFVLPNGKPGPTQVEPDVIPNSLEMSNVSVINSMIDLITTNRGFEMYTKTAQSIDQLNQLAITQVGKRP